MIVMTIEIDLAPTGHANEFGAHVLVHADVGRAAHQPPAVGATYVGICMAINEFMRARGCPDFDCLRPSKLKP